MSRDKNVRIADETAEMNENTGITSKATASIMIALGLGISGFALYGVNFIANTIAMAIALYIVASVLFEFRGAPKNVMRVFMTSAFAIVIWELSFSFLHQFSALCVALTVLLITIRHSLVRDHDSGWLGAVLAVGLVLIFLAVIEIILGIGRFFLV